MTGHNDVPYVISREGEAARHDDLRFEVHPEAGGLRLTYDRPDPRDWDLGVLRARVGRREGRPNYKCMNPRRQWRCMQELLCQNCGQTAVDPATGRTWWLLAAESGDDAEQGWASAPPICRGCIYPALAICPHLRQNAALYTVGDAQPFAVLAHLFQPADDLSAQLVEEKVMVDLEEFRKLGRALALELRVMLSDLVRAPIP
jgi:hypothetical protein